MSNYERLETGYAADVFFNQVLPAWRELAKHYHNGNISNEEIVSMYEAMGQLAEPMLSLARMAHK